MDMKRIKIVFSCRNRKDLKGATEIENLYIIKYEEDSDVSRALGFPFSPSPSKARAAA
jgi:hypothetical protein